MTKYITDEDGVRHDVSAPELRMIKLPAPELCWAAIGYGNGGLGDNEQQAYMHWLIWAETRLRPLPKEIMEMPAKWQDAIKECE